MQHYLITPDALSMTRNPVHFRMGTNLGPGVRQLMALLRVSGYALAELYRERRTSIHAPDLGYISDGASDTHFDFSAVLDDELSAEVPPAGGGHYAPPNACGRFVPFSPEVAADETLEATVSASTAFSPIGHTLEVGKWYRLVADYVDGYEAAGAYSRLSDGTNELPIFRGTDTNDIVWGGKVSMLLFAQYPYDEIISYVADWEVKVYEVPDRSFFALKGGWDFRLFPDRASALPEGRQLLSAMPDVRAWHPAQSAWLGVLPPSDEEYFFGATVQYTDGTSSPISSASLGTLPAFAPFLADISDAQWGYSLLNPAKTISKVLATISAPSISFSATAVLVASYANAPFRREFHFTNSLGGCDWLIAYGKGQASEEHTAEEYERHVAPGYESAQASPQYASLRQRPRQAFTVSSGYRSRDERDAAKEILQAEAAVIREGDLLVPIVVQAGTVQDEPDGDYRHKLSFSYRYAFDKLSSR